MRIISAVKAKKIADKYQKTIYKDELKCLFELINSGIVRGETSCTRYYYFIDLKNIEIIIHILEGLGYDVSFKRMNTPLHRMVLTISWDNPKEIK